MNKVAWIGTGVMGKPMALHLANAGYTVSVYNRTYEKTQDMGPLVSTHRNLEDAIVDADIIFTIVGYPKDVESVYDVIFDHAKKDALLIDMTTSSPSLARSLYAKAKNRGMRMLDAPVTGGDLGARNATLSIMCGGDEEDFASALPLLNVLGKTINYAGVAGNGQHAKLANQTAIAGALAGVAESLRYAQDKEIALDVMLSIIVGGSASSWQAGNNGPKMINHDYEPGFFIKHFHKDLKLVLEEKGDLYLPIVEKVYEIYDLLMSMGYSELGTQAIIEYYLKDL